MCHCHCHCQLLRNTRNAHVLGNSQGLSNSLDMPRCLILSTTPRRRDKNKACVACLPATRQRAGKNGNEWRVRFLFTQCSEDGVAPHLAKLFRHVQLRSVPGLVQCSISPRQRKKDKACATSLPATKPHWSEDQQEARRSCRQSRCDGGPCFRELALCVETSSTLSRAY